MYLTRILVLIATDDRLDENQATQYATLIEAAIGPQLERGAILEVRDEVTREVTLGAIDYALENHEAIPVDDSDEREAPEPPHIEPPFVPNRPHIPLPRLE